MPCRQVGINQIYTHKFSSMMKRTLLLLLFIAPVVGMSQIIEHISFSTVAGGSNGVEIVVGAPLGAYASKSGGSITLSSEYGNADFNGLLPIELLSFSVKCNGNYAHLAWTTASERNNESFIVERSGDAVNFVEIGRVAGAGNSIVQLDYTYNDYGIHGGYNYYRLLQVDYDGTRTASEIIVANCIDESDSKLDVTAYPNPFSDELTLLLSNFDNRSASIEIYDMLGKVIMVADVASPHNDYKTVLNLGNLPPSAYNIKVSTADFVINKQIIKN